MNCAKHAAKCQIYIRLTVGERKTIVDNTCIEGSGY